MLNGHLYIIGCGIGDTPFQEPLKNIVAEATVVAGGQRLLNLYATNIAPTAKQIPIKSQIQGIARELLVMAKTQKVVVLASGDPLFYGIGATIAKVAAPGSFTVIPNITAFQAAFAKLGVSWSTAALLSLHGSNNTVPWRKILQPRKAVVYCDAKTPAPKLAQELITNYPAAKSRKAAAFENLGQNDENFYLGTLEDIAQQKLASLSLLFIAEPDQKTQQPPLPFGLDDDAYQHENNLITHPEVRAIILSKLKLNYGGTLWDLGAGSGAVGIEAAGLCPNLRVISVERQANRAENIKSNAKVHGAHNLRVFNGEILSYIPELTTPDAVFVGGGGSEIAEIITASYEQLKAGGHIVVSAVTLETISKLHKLLPQSQVDIVQVAVSKAAPAGELTMLKANNPVYIFTFRKAPDEK